MVCLKRHFLSIRAEIQLAIAKFNLAMNKIRLKIAQDENKRLKRQRLKLKIIGYLLRFFVWMTRPRTRVIYSDNKLELALIYRWYDCWVGAYFDAAKQRLYVLPIFMAGLRITGKRPKQEAADVALNILGRMSK